MPATVSIRNYRAADWQHLCTIHDMARRDELACTVGVAAFRCLEDTFDDEGLFDDDLVVAELGDVVSGFVAFNQFEVTWLYVHPAYYRRGVGRALLRYVLQQSSSSIRIELLEGNTPAQQLYASEGFVVTERREGKLIGNESFSAAGLVLQNSE